MVDLELWKQRKKELGLSLQDIADISGVSISTVKDIFRGATTDPRIETVQRIENLLLFNTEKILTCSQDPNDMVLGLYYSLSAENKKLFIELIVHFVKLSQEKRKLVLSMLKAIPEETKQ